MPTLYESLAPWLLVISNNYFDLISVIICDHISKISTKSIQQKHDYHNIQQTAFLD